MRIEIRIAAVTLATISLSVHAGSLAELDPGPFGVVALEPAGSSMDWEDVNGDMIPDIAIRTVDLLRFQFINADGSIDATLDLTGIPYSSAEWAFVYADLTGDTISDVALIRGDTLEIHPGIGPGDGSIGWGAPTEIDLGSTTNVMLTADADGDGDLDLYVGGQSTNSVRLFRNDGAGAFAAPEVVTTSSPQSFIIAELNGDGSPDLVWVRSESAQCFIRLNDGTGAGGPVVSHEIGFNSSQGITGASQIVAADLDGDGDTDIAIANNRHDNVSVLLNDGAGGFIEDGTYDGAYRNQFLTAGDIDGDGDRDLICAGPSTGNTTPMVSALLRNNGDATFASESWFDADQNGIIAPVDMDGDGDLDMLYEQDGPCVVVNDGGFPDRPEFLSTNDWCCFSTPTLVSGDLNGDGLIDIVTDNHFQSLYVSFQQPDGSFSGNRLIARDAITGVRTVGDIDGDGDLDIVASYSGMRTFANNGDGTFGTVRTFSATAATPKFLADMDGDGDLDSIGFSNDVIAIMRNSGTGTFVEVYAEPVAHIGSGVAPVAVFDADGDGRLDIARWFSDGTTTFIAVRLNIGTWTFTPEVVSEAGILPIDRVAVADLNGDGALDAVTLGFESQTGVVLRNTGGGSFAIDRVFPNHGMRFSPALADFDGDGDLDYAGMNIEETRVIVLDNRGGGDFGDPLRIPSGQSGRGLIARDMNADGAIDLVSDYNSGGQFNGGASVVRYGVPPDAPGCNAADLAEQFGVLDLADISDFVGAFMTGGTPADLAEPFGVLDLADISAFVTAFVTGCP